jgi:hypothetical protein
MVAQPTSASYQETINGAHAMAGSPTAGSRILKKCRRRRRRPRFAPPQYSAARSPLPHPPCKRAGKVASCEQAVCNQTSCPGRSSSLTDRPTYEQGAARRREREWSYRGGD